MWNVEDWNHFFGYDDTRKKRRCYGEECSLEKTSGVMEKHEYINMT